MTLRFLLAPAAVAAGCAVVLAAACGGGLPLGEFPFDGGALDLGSCADGSPNVEIQSIQCPMADCPTTIAYAICTGSVYGACSCKGSAPGIDSGKMEDAIMTGTEGGAPDVSAESAPPAETGPSETGPTDTGPVDTGPKDTGPKDTGPKDTGPKDTGGGKG